MAFLDFFRTKQDKNKAEIVTSLTTRAIHTTLSTLLNKRVDGYGLSVLTNDANNKEYNSKVLHKLSRELSITVSKICKQFNIERLQKAEVQKDIVYYASKSCTFSVVNHISTNHKNKLSDLYERQDDLTKKIFKAINDKKDAVSTIRTVFTTISTFVISNALMPTTLKAAALVGPGLVAAAGAVGGLGIFALSAIPIVIHGLHNTKVIEDTQSLKPNSPDFELSKDLKNKLNLYATAFNRGQKSKVEDEVQTIVENQAQILKSQHATHSQNAQGNLRHVMKMQTTDKPGLGR